VIALGLEFLLPRAGENSLRYLMLGLAGSGAGASVSFLIFFYKMKFRGEKIPGNKFQVVLMKVLWAIGILSYLLTMAINKKMSP